MKHSIYDGNRNTIRVIKLDIEEMVANRDKVSFHQYISPKLPITESSIMSGDVLTYEAKVVEIITPERLRIKLALDKNSQELVDLFVELESNKYKEIIHINAKKFRIENDILNTKINKLENTWFNKIIGIFR